MLQNSAFTSTTMLITLSLYVMPSICYRQQWWRHSGRYSCLWCICGPVFSAVYQYTKDTCLVSWLLSHTLLFNLFIIASALAMRFSIPMPIDRLLEIVNSRYMKSSATSSTTTSMLIDGIAESPWLLTSIFFMLKHRSLTVVVELSNQLLKVVFGVRIQICVGNKQFRKYCSQLSHYSKTGQVETFDVASRV